MGSLLLRRGMIDRNKANSAQCHPNQTFHDSELKKLHKYGRRHKMKTENLILCQGRVI